MSASTEMPRYKSHKEVWAMKITHIDYGTRTLTLKSGVFISSVVIDDTWMRNNCDGDVTGGYYVVYDNGHKSWSPAESFEKGYTQVSGPRNDAMTGYDDGARNPPQGDLDTWFAMMYVRKFLLKPGESVFTESSQQLIDEAWRKKLGEHFRSLEDASSFSFDYTPTQRGMAAVLQRDFRNHGKPISIE
ncbi:hypothetical protein D3C71_77530 [compost metagenome]